LGFDGTDERLSPSALSGAIFVSATPQHGGLFAEVDDRGNLVELAVDLQGEKNPLQKMSDSADIPKCGESPRPPKSPFVQASSRYWDPLNCCQWLP
jgi:hypothetical protein